MGLLRFFYFPKMIIKLNNYIPSPLLECYDGNSDVWKKQSLLLNKSKSTLITSTSGKGKSSLISSVYGLRKDYSGEVYLNENNIKNLTPKNWSQIRTEKLAIVFQSLNLFPELNAFDNVMIKNQLSHYKSVIEIKEFFETLDMTPYINQAAATLSYGQQQRIAIIRALCQPFETILLDEPFSHLDQENAIIGWNLLKVEAEKQGAQIIITGLGDDTFIDAEQILKL